MNLSIVRESHLEPNSLSNVIVRIAKVFYFKYRLKEVKGLSWKVKYSVFA